MVAIARAYPIADGGTRHARTVCVVEQGRIRKAVSKLDVQERGSRREAFGRLRTWLLAPPGLARHALVDAAQDLVFDGKNAARMPRWLRRWQAQRAAAGNE